MNWGGEGDEYGGLSKSSKGISRGAHGGDVSVTSVEKFQKNPYLSNQNGKKGEDKDFPPTGATTTMHPSLAADDDIIHPLSPPG